MRWEVYDAFDRANDWPGARWFKADLGTGPMWDQTAVVSNPGPPDNTLTVTIPRFTLYRPPTHSKALMLSRRLFQVAPNSVFGARCTLAVEIFGTQNNPFGAEPGDPRLASGAMVTLDVQTGVVLDFLVTNDRIFAVYERLPYARTTLGVYPAFTHLIPTRVATSPSQWHRYEIRYDSGRDLAQWLVDDGLVAEHAPVGAPWGRRDLAVKLAGLRVGGSLFTLMDGGVPCEGELTPGTQPLAGLLEDPRDELFGQGGQAAFRDYQIGYGAS